MTSHGPHDDRRRAPQYGEYATPEEVAAIRGVPAPVPVEIPVERSAEVPAGRPAAAAHRNRAATLIRRLDRPLTLVLLALGVFNLISSAGALLAFDDALEIATEGTTAESIDFTDAARVGGIVLFVVTLALLVASGAIASALLRRGSIAFWVPLTAAALSAVVWFLALIVIVVQTPGALPTPGI